jgi:hypothetical protein
MWSSFQKSLAQGPVRDAFFIATAFESRNADYSKSSRKSTLTPDCPSQVWIGME